MYIYLEKFNVQKSYITTVKKEVTRVTEKYYDVMVEEPVKVVEEIFPTVDLYDIYTLKVGVFNDGLPEKTVEREFSFVNLPPQSFIVPQLPFFFSYL